MASQENPKLTASHRQKTSMVAYRTVPSERIGVAEHPQQKIKGPHQGRQVRQRCGLAKKPTLAQEPTSEGDLANVELLHDQEGLCVLYQAPGPQHLHWRDQPQTPLALKTNRACFQENHRVAEKEDSTPKKSLTCRLTHPRPQSKSSSLKRTNSICKGNLFGNFRASARGAKACWESLQEERYCEAPFLYSPSTLLAPELIDAISALSTLPAPPHHTSPAALP